MMNSEITSELNPDTTVGEIVARNYHAADVLGRHGLDFCCGGARSLREACENNNLDPSVVLKELQEISRHDQPVHENYQAWEAEYLIEHIENTHHRFVREKIREITAYAERVAGVHGQRYPETQQALLHFNNLSAEMTEHMKAEEEIVFPLIREISRRRKSGDPVETGLLRKLSAELEEMEDDHENAGNTMAAIRELTGGFRPPEDACTTYRIYYQNLAGFEEDLHKHVHLENNILFKKAEKLI